MQPDRPSPARADVHERGDDGAHRRQVVHVVDDHHEATAEQDHEDVDDEVADGQVDDRPNLVRGQGRQSEVFDDVHTEILIRASGDFLYLCPGFFGEGLLEMIEDDGPAHGDAIVDKITNQTTQPQYCRPRYVADQETDTHQELILYVVPHLFQRLKTWLSFCRIGFNQRQIDRLLWTGLSDK